MIWGIHYFITKLKKKIDVIPRGPFKFQNLYVRWVNVFLALGLYLCLKSAFNFLDKSHPELVNFLKRQFLPSLRHMRKCMAGKQNFTQDLPWAN